MPGFAFPQIYSGSLGPWFPTYTNRDFSPCPSVLCSAKTASALPARFALAPLRYLPFALASVSLAATTGSGSSVASAMPTGARALGHPVPLIFRSLWKETVGSPEIPGLPL